MSAVQLFRLVFSLMINFYFTVSSDHEMQVWSLMQARINNDVNKENNETDLFQKLSENYSTSTTENLFWTILDTSAATENNISFQNNVKETEPAKQIQFTGFKEINETASTNIDLPESEVIYQTNDDVWFNATMNEKITLQRNNCHLEIDILENYDLKTEIKFGKLENNTSGKCCITLNGHENSMLGVWISNVHLYQNSTTGEILKVITAQYGLDFLLKEYNAWSKYQPLLLTETHRVYILLYYNVTNVPANEQDSYFNLEVFSYYK